MDDANFDFDVEALGELGAKLAELAPDALRVLGDIVDAINAGLLTVDALANLTASGTNVELDDETRKRDRQAQASPDGNT